MRLNVQFVLFPRPLWPQGMYRDSSFPTVGKRLWLTLVPEMFLSIHYEGGYWVEGWSCSRDSRDVHISVLVKPVDHWPGGSIRKRCVLPPTQPDDLEQYVANWVVVESCHHNGQQVPVVGLKVVVTVVFTFKTDLVGIWRHSEDRSPLWNTGHVVVLKRVLLFGNLDRT